MARLVLRENCGAVVVLTLNRPEKLNALSPEMFIELRAVLESIAADGSNFRCVVLEGAGRAFCAGADIAALKAGTVMESPEFRSETVEFLGRMPQVIIAAVHGHCLTGGLELALAADVVVAAEGTMFRDTHAKLGIVPRWGMSVRLPRRIGLAAARRISVTCEPVAADEALRMGLCDYVVPRAELMDFARGLAERAAGNAPASVTAIKALYEHNMALPVARGLVHERAFTKGTTSRKG